jgi:hypothetical protein
MSEKVRLPQSDRDRRSSFRSLIETAESLKKFSTTLFIHRKVVFCTKLCLKKFGFHSLIETAEAASAVS